MTVSASSNAPNQTLDTYIGNALAKMENQNYPSANIYTPAFATTGSSGLSFGTYQNDVRTNPAAATVLQMALNDYAAANPSQNITTAQIANIMTLAKTSNITASAFGTANSNLVTAALTADAPLVAQQDQATLAVDQNYVTSFIANAQTFPGGPGVFDQNNLNPTVVAELAEWANQTHGLDTMTYYFAQGADTGPQTAADVQTYLAQTKYFSQQASLSQWDTNIGAAVTFAQSKQPTGTALSYNANANPIPAADADGDVTSLINVFGQGPGTDPDEASEGDEQITNVGGTGQDLRADAALHNPNAFSVDLPSFDGASLLQSLAAALGLSLSPNPGTTTQPWLPGLQADINTYNAASGGDGGVIQVDGSLIQLDPYDPNYKTVYTPITPPTVALPTLPASLPAASATALQKDLTASLAALGNVASDTDAVYVTQNRLYSAYNAGDLSSFTLQNTAMNKFVAALAASETAVGQADSALVTDLTGLGVNLDATQAQVTSALSTIKAQGIAALPAQEQAIIQAYLPGTDDQQMLTDVMTKTGASAVPPSLITTLQNQASQATGNGTGLTIGPPTDTTVPPLPNAGALDGLPPGTNFTVADTTTNMTVTSAGTPYSGPVAGLTNDIIIATSDNINVTANVASVFIKTGSGEDALNVAGVNGNNVMDGSTGSNFLVGGTGNDTFFVDNRSAPADIWSTVVNFHKGDAATIWGVTPQDFNFAWADGQGVGSYTGLTLHATATGQPTASLTLVGYSQTDMTNGRLSISFGTEGGTSTYMYIHANS